MSYIQRNKQLVNNIKFWIKYDYSDAYIQAKMYGKYKATHSIKEIDLIITELRATPIKLLLIELMPNGQQRFCCQLSHWKGTADFVMGTDGIMKIWRYGENGTDFYPFHGAYEIVNSLEELKIQPL